MMLLSVSSMPSGFELVPLIACFAALAYGSHEGLKLWLAVSQVPAPESMKITKVKVTKAKIALFVLAVIVFEAAVIFGLGVIPQVALDCIWAIGTYGFCTITMISALAPSVFSRFAIFRTVNGRIASRFTGSRLHFRLFAVLINLLVAGGMFLTYQGSGVPGVIFGATYALGLIRRMMFPKISIRKMIIGLVAYEAGVIVFSAVFVGGIIAYQHFFPGSPASADEADKPDSWFHWSINGEFITKFTFPLQALYIAMPGSLAAVSLRFDYYIHSLTAESLILESVEPAESEKKSEKTTHLPGVLLPAKLPAFKKPTFISALAAISASFIAPAVVLRVVGFQETNPTLSLATLIGFFVSIPVTSLAVIVAGHATGNFKEMWAYTENWAITPAVDAALVEEHAELGSKAEERLRLIGKDGEAA